MYNVVLGLTVVLDILTILLSFQYLKEVHNYEHNIGGIVLDPSTKDGPHHFSIKNSHTISPSYTTVYSKKALLIIRMLEIRIGAQLLIQVI